MHQTNVNSNDNDDDGLKLVIPASAPIVSGQINMIEIAHIHSALSEMKDVFAQAGLEPELDGVLANTDTQSYEIGLEHLPGTTTSIDGAYEDLLSQLSAVEFAVRDPIEYAYDRQKCLANTSCTKKFLQYGKNLCKALDREIGFSVAKGDEQVSVTISPKSKSQYDEAKSSLNQPSPQQMSKIEIKPIAVFHLNYVVSSDNQAVWIQHNRMREDLIRTGKGKYLAKKAKRTIEVWIPVDEDKDDDPQLDMGY